MESFKVATRDRIELKDVTDDVRSAVAKATTGSGVAFVSVPHTTAAITINESCDPDVARDIEKTLGRLVPPDAGYAHSEGNSDAHVKASLVGSSAQVPVENGQLVLGRWQGVFFCEFDGPRQRQVWVQVLTSAR
jgi:secondary thiamine-phosphate synthase enzyme